LTVVAGGPAELQAALETFRSAQSPDPNAVELIGDTLEELSYRCALGDAAQALHGAAELVALRATVELRWQFDAGSVDVRSDRRDRWEAVEAGLLLEFLGRDEEPPEFSTEELLAAVPSLDRVDRPDETFAVVRFEKRIWSEPITRETRRAVWIGPSADGFADWVAAQPNTALQRLLGAPGGGLVLATDVPPTAPDSAARLVIAAPDARPAAVPDDTQLVGRLEASHRTDDLPLWRTVSIDVDVAAPAADRVRLAVAWAAAVALAEVRDDSMLRPSRVDDRSWDLDEFPAATEASDGLVQLARWVAADFGETRLTVARAIAAKKVGSPFEAVPAAPVLEAAEIAYRVAIHEEVREALTQQRELETAFLELDSEVTKLRESLSSSVDQVVTRALTAALAVTIAALTARQVRGWPVTAAGAAVMVYLWTSASYVGLSVWRNAKSRLSVAETVVSGRGSELGRGLAMLTGHIGRWRGEIRTQVVGSIVLLGILGLLSGVGGYLGNGEISPLYDDAEAQPKKPKSALGVR
jgi:hypothetical protein